MSNLNPNRDINTRDENSNYNEQENSNTTVNMDLVKEKERVEQRGIRIVESKNFMCIDIENSIEPLADKTEDIFKREEQIDTKELKIKVISQGAERSKYTVMALQDHVVNAKQIRRQGLPPVQPQQTTLTQSGPPGQTGRPDRPDQPDQTGEPGQPEGNRRYNAYVYDDRGPLLYDPRSRNSFVARVLSIVFVMLVATSGFLIFVLTTPDVEEFFYDAGWGIIVPAVALLLTVDYTLMFSPRARRPPCNYICLILAIVAVSIVAAKITSMYDTDVILYATLATGGVLFACTILAFTKFDFTSYKLYIVVLSMAFTGIVLIIILHLVVTGTFMKPLIIVVLVVGTLILVVLLTIELQMILGGKTIELGEADYALAAFMIYTSIVSIFLSMATIMEVSN